MKTNFLQLTEILHQSLVDANLNDKQFNSIWSAINDVHSKLRITDVSQRNELLTFLEEVASEDRIMSSARIRERSAELLKVNCG